MASKKKAAKNLKKAKTIQPKKTLKYYNPVDG